LLWTAIILQNCLKIVYEKSKAKICRKFAIGHLLLSSPLSDISPLSIPRNYFVTATRSYENLKNLAYKVLYFQTSHLFSFDLLYFRLCTSNTSNKFVMIKKTNQLLRELLHKTRQNITKYVDIYFIIIKQVLATKN
jgi:hypothetical protein